jgi:membrane protein YdbS with pleckstrin-like domain
VRRHQEPDVTDPQRHESHRQHHLRTPTGQLPHEEKVRRQQRHVTFLTLALVAVLAMLAYSAAFDLDHWAEWVVLGGICCTAVGVIIAAQSQARP